MNIFEKQAEAWEAYFAGWLEAKGITVKDLGLTWTGNGGENQLKHAFAKWYDLTIIRRPLG